MSLSPSPDTQEIKWLAILRASQALVSAAEQSQWNDLPLHAQYRDKLIREYFSKPLTVENALRVQDQIQQILALDEQVLGCARRQQEQNRTTLKNLHSGSKAIKAYQS